MGARAILHYGWIVAPVPFGALMMTAGVRAAPGVLIESDFQCRGRQSLLRSASDNSAIVGP
jgi:hypothetical protein